MSLSALPGSSHGRVGLKKHVPEISFGDKTTPFSRNQENSFSVPERSGDQLFAEFVIVYGAACQTGNCPNAQKSPVTTVQVVEAPIYRPRPLAGLLRKNRRVSAPVIILTVPEAKKEESK